jgi:hypothetical protein
MVKGQRVRFHSDGGGGVSIYGHVSKEKRKGVLVIVTLKSFWNVLESSKGLYKHDISTIGSNYYKYFRVEFFYADNDLIIDVNENIHLY